MNTFNIFFRVKFSFVSQMDFGENGISEIRKMRHSASASGVISRIRGF
jgi:hypothetical protein